MLIDFRELLSGSKDDESFEVRIDMNELDVSGSVYPITGKDTFVIEAHKTGRKKVNITCKGSVRLDIPCDRCLEPVPTDIDFDVNELLEFEKNDTDEDYEEKDYIDGYNLDVDKLIFGELVVGLPGKCLCREDCKGLCSVCGHNLNVSECGCDRVVSDPRMSVFKDILNNFKEV